ncbi:uncharacterized protein LOC103936487 isoform X2 [Pyrus x bretschneideri]|uniref:uncharacterized protein LOC103936487 isoform X2 n=1 Tax=Pyrus x bretschneideri TaxID=225117 RepID=UPI00202DC44F|nr:uncharacterized protein LOC103936487 isoform X2 [Pyrus x bretschneideri]
MASVIGWYGPLIDLSKAAFHVGDYVQLVVYVHRTTPLQYKLAKGGEVIRTDIQVGDETRPFFSVSIWQKPIGSMAVAGDVVLFQRVNDLIEECRDGVATKEKLKRVVEWVKKRNTQLHGCQLQEGRLSRNWKPPEERKQPEDCFSLLQLSTLTSSCKALFYASVAEIFLPFNSTSHVQCKSFDKEDMFVSRRLYKAGDGGLARDLICTGCQLCGSPLELDSENMFKQNAVALYCSESSNHLHVISSIYRPFMLYVWDESDYAPLLVRNKAAELLFGNVKAERVYSWGEKQAGQVDSKDVPTHSSLNAEAAWQPKAAEGGVLVSCSAAGDKKSSESRGKHCFPETMHFYRIWLILLKTMLQRGKNSPLKFVVDVNAGLDKENGRFEMVSVQLPCFETK